MPIRNANWLVNGSNNKQMKQQSPLAAAIEAAVANSSAPEQSPAVPAFQNVQVIRQGSKIILPEGMSYPEGRLWLTRQEEAEEKNVGIYDQIPCYPLDGAVALMSALKEVFGFASLQDTPGFFGSSPPMLVQVPLFNGSFETAPLGRIGIPKWEGGYISTHVDDDACLHVKGEIKRKFEAEVKGVIKLTREILKTSSIYKGHAVSIDLEWMEGEEAFNPITDAPKFMDTAAIDEDALILNEVTQFELKANIFTLIEQTEACRRNSIPLKHGCLLLGPYGTGKTLTARVMAKKCERNGWTFLYLKSARHLAKALRLAQLYSPAVVFTEDIDQAVDNDRDEAVNEILNTMDGVDTKDQPVITILTTNHPDDIQPGFLRAGRIDTVVSMEAPDEKTAQRFVEKFAISDNGVSLLVPGTDLTEAGKALSGFVPAFIAEAVQKAKRFAIHREGSNINGKVTGHDVMVAAQALRKHAKMVDRKSAPTDEERVAKSVQLIHSYGAGENLPS